MPYKLFFLLLILCGTLNLKAQFDTAFYSGGDYSISLRKDSCNATTQLGDKMLNRYVALGNPSVLCDRIYFKNGIKFDQKKSYTFGYVYLQLDTNKMVRQHILSVDILQTYLAVNITDSGKAFWSNFKSPHFTNYWLFDNGRFREVNTIVQNNTDSVSTQLFALIKKYGNPQLANQWTNNKNEFTLTYSITFLPCGLINNYGYMLNFPNKPPIRIGTWYDYNLYCDCYVEKDYYIK